jgi:hypothetical protein
MGELPILFGFAKLTLFRHAVALRALDGITRWGWCSRLAVSTSVEVQGRCATSVRA